MPFDAASAPTSSVAPTTAATALYVHVPFCTRKCPYCAFACTDDYDRSAVAAFLRGVPLELAYRASRAVVLDTLYMGGGTPSALGDRGFAALMSSLRPLIDRTALREFTVELNPAHVDDPLASTLFAEKVDRVSLGAQTFHAGHLRRLGRDHEAADVEIAWKALERSGIKKISLDLMYGLPLQTKREFLDDLRRGLDLGCKHFSLYALEFEPTTPFGFARARGRLAPIDDGGGAEMFHAARELLSAHGIDWYEVSNFAAAGEESIHNRVYWRNGPYYGIGPGAYGRLGDRRYCNVADVMSWSRLVEAGADPSADTTILGAHDDALETLVAGLRTRDGVATEAVSSDPRFAATADELIAEKFAERSGGRFFLTLRGLLVLDALLPRFLPEVRAGR